MLRTGDAWTSCRSTDSSKPAKSVNFSSFIEVLFPVEDELGSESTQLLPERALKWKDKPWRIKKKKHRQSKGVKEHHFPSQGAFRSPQGFQPEYERLPEVAPVQTPMHLQPDFIQHLAQAGLEFGELTQDERLTFQVVTWYLHGNDYRINYRARVVRLNDNSQSWIPTSPGSTRSTST